MIKKFIGALGAAALIVVFAHPAFAEVEGVRMRVDGMTCPFCIYGIEKNLKKIDGIENPSSNLKTGTIDLSVAKGKQVYAESLKKAVEDSGFTARDIEITVTGELIEYEDQGNNHPALRVQGTGQIFLLDTASEETGHVLSAESKMPHSDANGGEKAVTITGALNASEDGLPQTLTVDELKVN